MLDPGLVALQVGARWGKPARDNSNSTVLGVGHSPREVQQRPEKCPEVQKCPEVRVGGAGDRKCLRQGSVQRALTPMRGPSVQL